MDLTGKRFGRLLVLERDPIPYRDKSGKPTPRWICRCDCGNVKSILQNTLTRGAQSCGCIRAEKLSGTTIDMVGQRFGRLTVTERAELPKALSNGQRTGWRCRCNCGNEIIASRKDLLSGKLLSCGCLLAETARDKIINTNVVGHYVGTTVSAIRPGRPPNKNNRSGVKGVYWNDREGRWIAKIGVRGKSITLGRYAKLEDAARARREAEEKYYTPIIAAYDQKTNKKDME